MRRRGQTGASGRDTRHGPGVAALRWPASEPPRMSQPPLRVSGCLRALSTYTAHLTRRPDGTPYVTEEVSAAQGILLQRKYSWRALVTNARSCSSSYSNAGFVLRVGSSTNSLQAENTLSSSLR